MQKITKNLSSYQLHLIKTDGFKSVLVKVCFHTKIQKEKVTERNFLVNLLLCSTKNIPSKKEISTKCQDLYAAQISSSNRRIGAFMDTTFTLSLLEDKYTEPGNFRKALNLLHEILLEPNVKENEFNQKDFEIIKAQHETDIKSTKENLSRYSIIRALENLDRESPIAIRSDGYLEDLEKITPQSLYEHYQEMIMKDTIDIFVIGNIDFEEAEKEIRDVFQFKTFKKEKGKALLPNPKVPKRKRTVVEHEKVTQTKLVIACRTCDLEDYERNYPLTLYNIILGGSGDSKLFQEVREKHSLCYDIRSVTNKADNCLLIMAGINKDGKDKAVKAIETEMKKMEQGKFSEEDLLKAKEFYLSSFDVVEDSMSKLAESYYMMELLGVDDIETRKEKMKDVSYEEVINVAKKVKIDLIYTMEGDEDETITA